MPRRVNCGQGVDFNSCRHSVYEGHALLAGVCVKTTAIHLPMRVHVNDKSEICLA